MSKVLLSKTTYLKGVQCRKAVYLNKYHSKYKDPLPAERLVRFNEGHEIGFKAQELFPGGVNVAPSIKTNSQKALLQTEKLIEQKATIYEAAFTFDQVIIYLDILVFTPEGWIAYEVKSGTEVSEVYKKDIALQYNVILGSGLRLKDIKLLYLTKNRKEIERSDRLENIFKEESIVEYCQQQTSSIKSEIQDIKKTLAFPSIPDIKMGDHCSIPYTCDFISFCTKQNSNISEGLFSI